MDAAAGERFRRSAPDRRRSWQGRESSTEKGRVSPLSARSGPHYAGPDVLALAAAAVARPEASARMHVIVNFLLIVFEIAACAGLAWLGLTYPMPFAAATAALAFALGLRLEVLRLRNEMPFYFGPGNTLRGLFLPFVGFGEALFKGLLAGVAALFTFSGTDHDRLVWVAAAFGLTIYIGVGLLRFLAIKLDARPERWGFFRLGPPLGLLFSALIALLAVYGVVPAPTVGDIGWTIVWEMPKVPTVEQASELFFRLKQAFDEFVVTLLSTVLPPAWARGVGIVLSVNVLAGFVAALYAAILAGIVRRVEG